MIKIFEQENSKIDYKSLKKAIGKSANLSDLAKTCVCFANAQGGYIIIGVEDKDRLPPVGQKIEQKEINELIRKLRTLTDSVGIANPQTFTHENGGEYFSIQILPSMKTIATTSDGRVYIRIADECTPVKSEELTRLASEKGAFQWELITTKTTLEQIPSENIDKFINDIKASDRVSNFIKNLSQIDILEYYRLVDNDQLTNLGLLWLGTFKQRGKLNYPLTVQYIVYNENEEKIRKVEWTHNDLNPKELLLDIEAKTIELNYSYELPNGLFRKQIRHYPKEVIREILVNAFIHKSFTISGDIFINAYHDRLRDWISKLIEKKLIITEGKTKGAMYQINPKILSSMMQNIKPSLKTMEEHKLKALIIEDLKIHPKSKMAEIHARYDEFSLEYIRKIVYKLVKDGDVESFGEKKNKTYSMANKK